MNKPLNEMSPDEENIYIDKLNEDFKYFLVAIPFVELGDVTDGNYIKLKTQLFEYSPIADILFELQWNLHRYGKTHPELGACKLIVSELMLTTKMPNTTFRRGLMIKIKYEQIKYE